MNFDGFAVKVESLNGYRPTKIQGISNIARVMDGSIFLGGPNLERFDGDRPYSFCSRISFSPTTHLFFCIDFGSKSQELQDAVKNLDSKRINNTKVLIDDSGVFVSTNPDINTGGYTFDKSHDVRVSIEKFLFSIIGDISSAQSTLEWLKSRIKAKIIAVNEEEITSNSILDTNDSNTINVQRLPKPFLLLAGISGTGKTRFVKQQAELSCSGEIRCSNGEPSNLCLVSVRPDWHEPSDLLGYISRIGGANYIATEFLKFLVKTWLNAVDEEGITRTPDQQMTTFWLCLDEMNLAPVEQYFADFLSVLETRKWNQGRYTCAPLLSSSVIRDLAPGGKDQLKRDLVLDGEGKQNRLWERFCNEGIAIPPNLIVAGTVNMDETTHSFSRKVIDRALTIDFGEFFPNRFEEFFNQQTRPRKIGFPILSKIDPADLKDVSADPDGSKSIQFLSAVNNILTGTPFELAYRALNELLLSVACFSPATPVELQAVWDDFVMMKILPRVDGDMEKLRYQEEKNILQALSDSLSIQLVEIWNGMIRPDLLRESVTGEAIPPIRCRSNKKIQWMIERLDKNGFTSFWP